MKRSKNYIESTKTFDKHTLYAPTEALGIVLGGKV